MLRLTALQQGPSEIVLAVDGWIVGEGVQVLKAEGERWLAGGKRLVLDLHGRRSISPAGIALLRQWTGAGSELRDGSLFVRTLLAAHGLAVEGTG